MLNLQRKILHYPVFGYHWDDTVDRMAGDYLLIWKRYKENYFLYPLLMFLGAAPSLSRLAKGHSWQVSSAYWTASLTPTGYLEVSVRLTCQSLDCLNQIKTTTHRLNFRFFTELMRPPNNLHHAITNSIIHWLNMSSLKQYILTLSVVKW